MRHTSFRAIAATALTFVVACSGSGGISAPPVVTPKPDTALPVITREMRGLWVATVANIDWPSRAGLAADQQRAELTDILDRAASLGLNAIVLQVRSNADALYNSPFEPWASQLMGTQGLDPGYDPLSFAVSEAHARGLELHAWINPFRVGNASDSTRFAPNHVFRQRRDLVRVYGGSLWLDPGEADAQDRVMRAALDIAQRYDVDAIHADDYYYPYPVTDASGRVIDFPDDSTYARANTTLSRADWRRGNIDRFVERLYRDLHVAKPMLRVGISPFGIWRPGFPSGVAGLDAYAAIYADSRKWLQQGWVDYLAPQLYWSIGAPQQSFAALLDWWMSQNAMGRRVWPGLAAYRVGDGTSSAYTSSEIPDQIRLTRSHQDDGHLLYNTTATLKRSGGAVASSLAPLYPQRALVPAFPWLDGTTPAAPTLSISGRLVQFSAGSAVPVRWWVIRARIGDQWTTKVVFGDQRTTTLDAEPTRVVVNAVSAAGVVSSDASWLRP
jgi:uncharacterized lipoprotein YddW (UPF0748 family)